MTALLDNQHLFKTTLGQKLKLFVQMHWHTTYVTFFDLKEKYFISIINLLFVGNCTG